MADNPDADILQLTTKIVSAHISHNTVGTDALPELIQSVYHSLTMAGTTGADPRPLTPAVSIRKSVFPDYIVCLEDGKKLRMLKRHLQASYGMTPQQYREKWGLPANYPMVASVYASRRSTLAKQLGLGRKPGNAGQMDLEVKADKPNLPAEPRVIQGRARHARGSKG